MTDIEHTLRRLLSERILVLDGAMGTMIQARCLVESDFRGAIFADHPRDLAGCNDVLSLTRPDVIEDIHRAYLEAGADIIETNSFNATSISLADYGLQDRAREISSAAARIARRAAEGVAEETGRPRFVAGSIGPTNRTASLSPDVNRPDLRGVTFEELATAYADQVRGLLDGGVDLLLPETTFDTLNLKAALFAIEQVFDEVGRRVPVIASITVTDRSGRTLSGQTLEACWISIAHADLLAVGLNCALGPEEMRPYLEELAELVPVHVACVPNAGLPNEMGGYDETPTSVAGVLGAFADRGWLNLAGGCCGTTPDHVRAIAAAVAGKRPRELQPRRARLEVSGLEPYRIEKTSNFTLIGERTNVTGSRRFQRLILDGRFEEAVEVARQQVEGGANVIDVNMDDGMLDAPEAMTRFLNLIGSEPDIARVPVMLDSSRFEAIEAGLRCLQGKGIVNSISLKEGETAFLEQARRIRRYGAAVVVMCFDEEGQAVDLDRRLGIARRAWRLLTEDAGFPPEDIIIDPNVLAVATGMEEHRDYARGFIAAVDALKRELPGCHLSGGISNVSFAFRGNEPLRRAMHAVFLYHAIGAGLDMGIVNAGQLDLYEEIPAELKERVEDVVLNRRDDATERLIAFAATMERGGPMEAKTLAWRSESLERRIEHALLHGIVEFAVEDMEEALAAYPSALSIIEGPLMDGMTVVGDLFGAGKMFLPQVV